MASMVTPKKDRNGTYYIRVSVPQKLRDTLNKTELKRSLRTKTLSEAKRLAPSIIEELNATIDKARRQHESEALLSDSLIVNSASIWLHHSLKASRDNWSNQLTPTIDGFTAETDELSSLLSLAQTNKDSLDELVQAIQQDIEHTLELNDLDVPTNSTYWELFVTEVAKAKIKLIETCYEHFLQSQKFIKFKEDIFNLPEYTPPSYLKEEWGSSTSSDSIIISKLYERYCNALHRRIPDSAKQRISSYRAAHQRLIKFCGDKPVKDISKKDIVDFRNILEQLPRMPKPAVNQLSLERQIQLAEEEGLLRISPKSVRTQLTAVSALLEFAVNEALIESNPAHGVGKDISRQSSTPAEYYSADEIKAIFSSAIYTDNAKPKQANYGIAHYWLPLLLYYTGARVEEVAQLYIADIKIDTDIPHLKLTNEREDQSIKTAEIRTIPIHAHLLELGFNEYVISQPATGRLFPELSQDSQGKYSYHVANWLSKYIKNEVNISRHNLKPMHGFRHTFITLCRELGIREDVQNAITGHSQKSMGAQYGIIPLDVMQTSINQIPKCQ